jgi:LysR family transcriptional regulator, carnitine catabolism transcriptional activator
MAINYSLAQLATFLAVAETKSFRAAAERLGVSQPAASERVRQLEERLGVTLLHRTTRSVTLTAEGEKLATAAARSLAELGDIAEELRDEARLQRGRIVVAAMPSLAAAMLPPVMAAFRGRQPGIRVELLDAPLSRVLEAVAQGEAAMAVTSRPERRKAFDFAPLFEDPCFAVIRRDHRLARKGAVSLAELAAEPLICSPKTAGLRETVESAFATARLGFAPAHEATTMETLIGLAEAGFGITFVPGILLPRIRLARCRAVPIAKRAMAREIGVATAHGRALSPAAAAFRNFLQQRRAAQAAA